MQQCKIAEIFNFTVFLSKCGSQVFVYETKNFQRNYVAKTFNFLLGCFILKMVDDFSMFWALLFKHLVQKMTKNWIERAAYGMRPHFIFKSRGCPSLQFQEIQTLTYDLHPTYISFAHIALDIFLERILLLSVHFTTFSSLFWPVSIDTTFARNHVCLN